MATTTKSILGGCVLLLALLVTGCSSSVEIETVIPTQTDTVAPTLTATSLPPTATITPTPTIASTPTETPIPPEIMDARNVDMVFVPAGEFIMGRDDYAPNEAPAHTVMLDAYYIDKFEVYNTSFADFLNEKGNQIEGYANWVEANDPDLRIHEINGVWTVDEGYENYPMNEVTWFGAKAYCEWRGGHLPTEAQWEKAARGTDGRMYPWGDDDISCDKANSGLCGRKFEPVDSNPEGVSPYGAYNMAGNAMEWVADWYSNTYFAQSPLENPTGPEQTGFRLFRGGSYINTEHNVRTTYRFAKLPVLTYATGGFRCAADFVP